MFDIGFWEIVLISIIALLAVGPDRLPGFARDTGKYVGKIRRFISNTRREIEQELHLDEQKKLSQQLSELDDLVKNAPDKDPDFVASLGKDFKDFKNKSG
ncbi:MAG: Sec-independent protein translocase protein TatB [Gammaproteobacteria bacterium]